MAALSFLEELSARNREHSAENRDRQTSMTQNTGEEIDELHRSVAARRPAEPLSTAETISLGTFAKVWERRMKTLAEDDSKPTTLKQLLYEPPVLLQRALVRASAPQLVQVFSSASKWQRVNGIPDASALTGGLSTLPELILSKGLCYLGIADLTRTTSTCKSLLVLPLQPAFFHALAGPFKDLFYNDIKEPCVISAIGNISSTDFNINKNFAEVESLVELSRMIRQCQAFSRRGLADEDRRAAIPGIDLLLEIDGLPEADLSFDVLSWICQARPILQDERTKLTRLHGALLGLSTSTARGHISNLLAVSLAVGNALAQENNRRLLDSPLPFAVSFDLNDVHGLRTIKSRFHSDFTLEDFTATVVDNHGFASLDVAKVAAYLQITNQLHRVLPRTAASSRSRIDCSASTVPVKIAELYNLRGRLRRWRSRLESGCTVQLHVDDCRMMGRGVERMLWLLELINAELEELQRLSRVVVRQYIELHSFLQGPSRAPLVSESGHLIRDSHSCARETSFSRLVNFALATTAQWHDFISLKDEGNKIAVAGGKEEGTICSIAQRKLKDAREAWQRAKVAGLLDVKVGTSHSTKDVGPSCSSVETLNTEKDFQSSEKECQLNSNRKADSSTTISFKELQAQVSARLAVSNASRVEKPGSSRDLDSWKRTKSESALLRQWNWEPEYEPTRRSDVFAAAPSICLDKTEMSDLLKLFVRGAFVGEALAKGKKAREHFTMDHFERGAHRSSDVPIISKMQEDCTKQYIYQGFFQQEKEQQQSNTRNEIICIANEASLEAREIRLLMSRGELSKLNLNATELEKYLTPQEFMSVFSMEREEFLALPKWRQATLKKGAGLF